MASTATTRCMHARPGAPRAPLAAALAALLGLLAPAPGHAQTGVSTHDPDRAGSDDYQADNERWNGLHTLAAVAKGMGLEVDAVTNIDWNDVAPGDILVILDPIGRLDPSHVAGFVRGGGRLLLADDFGLSSEAFARLGMLRDRTIGVGARRFYHDLSYVPMAEPLVPDHPLAAGVTELATNHPAVLVKVSGAEVVFGFSPSEGLVAAGALGRGRFVAVSDPSVFINRMLQFQGNLQFTVNTLRFLVTDGVSHRVIILCGSFDLYGEPVGLFDDGTVSGTVATGLGEINRWLDERNDYLLTVPGMTAVAIILSILVGLVALLSLPVTRKAFFDGLWTRAHTVAQRLPYEDTAAIVAQHEQAGYNNYLLPASVLRESVNRRLARLLGESDPLTSRVETDLIAVVAARAGPDAAAPLGRICRRLRALPSRVQAASPWSTSQISRRELERLDQDVAALFRALDKAAAQDG